MSSPRGPDEIYIFCLFPLFPFNSRQYGVGDLLFGLDVLGIGGRALSNKTERQCRLAIEPRIIDTKIPTHRLSVPNPSNNTTASKGERTFDVNGGMLDKVPSSCHVEVTRTHEAEDSRSGPNVVEEQLPNA